jgi:hypothetical protein
VLSWNVLPYDAAGDVADEWSRDPEISGDGHLAFFDRETSSDFEHIRFCELGVAIAIAARQAFGMQSRAIAIAARHAFWIRAAMVSISACQAFRVHLRAATPLPRAVLHVVFSRAKE